MESNMPYKCNQIYNYITLRGYTHIDSASYYKNGNDIRVPKREDFFITSKIASYE